MPGSRVRSAATRLVLPPPDGAASTNRHPDAGGALVGGSGAPLTPLIAASAAASTRGVPFVGRCQSTGDARPPNPRCQLRDVCASAAAVARGRALRALASPRSQGCPPWPALREARSFQILNLFPHLLDQHLHLERCLRQLGVDRLRSQRV